jgi:hypothetical protein
MAHIFDTAFITSFIKPAYELKSYWEGVTDILNLIHPYFLEDL